MVTKKGVLVIAISLALALAVSGLFNKPSAAQDDSVSQKLSEIADAQKRILDELAQMKEELRIIKIRITQNQ